MNPALKAYCCFLIFSATAAVTSAQQTELRKLNEEEELSEIKTAYVSIDFATTKKLRSVQNVEQTREGMQTADPARTAILLSEDISVPLDTIAPFLALGSRWVVASSGKESENIRIEIRSSTDTQQWSEWSKIEIDEHLTTREDTLIGRLQYISEATRFVQFRIVLSGSDQKTDQIQLRSLRFSFTSPGATPSGILKTLERRSTRQKQREPQPGQKQKYPVPDYMTRTGWGCPDGQQPSGPVTLTDVTHQIIHHSAGPNSSSDWPAVVRSIWDYHVNTNNWSDIGYNWLVDPNGIIYQGRGWIDGNDEVQGAHFCGTNSNTMGVCLLGNFEEVRPASEALGAAEDLLAWKSDQKNIDPLARNYHSSSELYLNTISGHRDGCSTLCPGENLYVKLPGIRNNVDALLGEPPVVDNDIETVINYPNPFTESTTISFSLKKAGNVQITIWDITGKRVYEVADRFYEEGENTATWNASGYSSGIYFCQVKLGEQRAVQKMVLVR